MSCDITAVVNLHTEGYLCEPSLESVRRAVRVARNRGVTVEVLLVFDAPDERTLSVARSRMDEDWRSLVVDFRDLGASRNFGASESSGELVAFLDADDLWGADWLAACVDAARRSTRKVVWHPELSIYFDGACHVFRHIDMESAEFDLLDLAFSNLWTALACTHRGVLLEVPYPSTDLSRRLGYEDWGWNLATIEAGYLHKTIPGSGHAVRVKSGQTSLLQQTNRAGAIPRPSKAFRTLLGYSRYCT